MYSNPFERLRAITRWSGDDEIGLAVEAAGALGGMARDSAGLVVACRRMLAHHPLNAPLWWACAHILGAADPAGAARQIAGRLDADRTGPRLASSLPFQRGDAVGAVVGWPPVVDFALGERADIDVVVVRDNGGTGTDTTRRVRDRSSDRRVRLVHAYELSTLPISLVLVEAIAVGPKTALVDSVMLDVFAELPSAAELWLIAGLGRVLPGRLVDAVVTAGAITNDPKARIRSGLETAAAVIVPIERFDRIAGVRGVETTIEGARRAHCPIPPELLRPLDL